MNTRLNNLSLAELSDLIWQRPHTCSAEGLPVENNTLKLSRSISFQQRSNSFFSLQHHEKPCKRFQEQEIDFKVVKVMDPAAGGASRGKLFPVTQGHMRYDSSHPIKHPIRPTSYAPAVEKEPVSNFCPCALRFSAVRFCTNLPPSH